LCTLSKVRSSCDVRSCSDRSATKVCNVGSRVELYAVLCHVGLVQVRSQVMLPLQQDRPQNRNMIEKAQRNAAINCITGAGAGAAQDGECTMSR
jgi:hypothetical protein